MKIQPPIFLKRHQRPQQAYHTIHASHSINAHGTHTFRSSRVHKPQLSCGHTRAKRFTSLQKTQQPHQIEKGPERALSFFGFPAFPARAHPFGRLRWKDAAVVGDRHDVRINCRWNAQVQTL